MQYIRNSLFNNRKLSFLLSSSLEKNALTLSLYAIPTKPLIFLMRQMIQGARDAFYSHEREDGEKLRKLDF